MTTTNTEVLNEAERTAKLLLETPVATTLFGSFTPPASTAEFCILRGKINGSEDRYQREFEAEVTAKMREGWQLHGTMTVLNSGTPGWFHVTQAMIKG